MRKMQTWMVHSLLLAGLLLAHPVAAAAGGIYRWTTADGTVAFTDDPKRIPARYQKHAVEIPAVSLQGYRHFTPAPPPKESAATTAYVKRLDARIAHLAAINATPPAREERPTQVVFAPSQAPTIYGLSGQSGQTVIGIPNSAASAGPGDSQKPLVATEARVRSALGSVTRHVTIFRRGDHVVSVIGGEPTESSASWPRMQQLTGQE